MRRCHLHQFLLVAILVAVATLAVPTESAMAQSPPLADLSLESRAVRGLQARPTITLRNNSVPGHPYAAVSNVVIEITTTPNYWNLVLHSSGTGKGALVMIATRGF